MNSKKALARFFPRGSGYDKEKADRLARWLDQCGYMIVPKRAQHRFDKSTLVPVCAPREPALAQHHSRFVRR